MTFFFFFLLRKLVEFIFSIMIFKNKKVCAWHLMGLLNLGKCFSGPRNILQSYFLQQFSFCNTRTQTYLVFNLLDWSSNKAISSLKYSIPIVFLHYFLRALLNFIFSFLELFLLSYLTFNHDAYYSLNF